MQEMSHLDIFSRANKLSTGARNGRTSVGKFAQASPKIPRPFDPPRSARHSRRLSIHNPGSDPGPINLATVACVQRNADSIDVARALRCESLRLANAHFQR